MLICDSLVAAVSLNFMVAAASLNTTCKLARRQLSLMALHSSLDSKSSQWRTESGWRWNKRILLILVHFYYFCLIGWWFTVAFWFVGWSSFLSDWLVGLLTLTFWQHCTGESAWHRLGRNENGETKMTKRQVSLFFFMGSGQSVWHFSTASETENYAEDEITVLADKFGLPAAMGTVLLPSFPVTGSKCCFRSSRGHSVFLGNRTFEEACQHNILDFSDDYLSL